MKHGPVRPLLKMSKKSNMNFPILKSSLISHFGLRVASRLKMVAFKHYACPEKCPQK